MSTTSTKPTSNDNLVFEPRYSNITPLRKFLTQRANVVKAARLSWVEYVTSIYHGHHWSIEYTYYGEHSISFLREFSVKFDRITDLQTFNIFTNNIDRITLHVNGIPKVYNESVVATVDKLSKKEQKKREWRKNQLKQRQGIGFVQGETLFKTSASLAPELEAEPTKLDAPLPLQDAEPISLDGPVLTNNLRKAEPTKLDVSEQDSSSIKFDDSPIVRMTRTSVEYAKSRLRDSKIFDLVRNYLGYFRYTEENQIIDGESKVTSIIKIKSEGLPIDDQLEQLYIAYQHEYGIDERAVKEDLERLKCYNSTSRLIRIQTARQHERTYLGLKGGSAVSSSVVVKQEQPLPNTKYPRCIYAPVTAYDGNFVVRSFE